MKKAINITVLVLTSVFLLATCKNPKIDYETFSISKETVKPEAHKVTVLGEYAFLGVVSSMRINIGLNEQLSDAESYLMDIDDKIFSVSVDSLNPRTLYYYCYVVEFGDGYKYLTETKEFITLSDKPLVSTLEVMTFDATTFHVKCKVDDDYGMVITERGILWNTVGTPDINDHKVKHAENGVGEYICIMDNLEPNTTYFVRAYAINEKGIGLGEVLDFQTGNGQGLPEVITCGVSEITATSARCGGEVLSDGGSQVIRRGVCWSIEHNPTIDNDHTVDGSGLGSFDSFLDNLTPNTTYYVRAYATNSTGTGYGAEMSFSALNGLPEVITLEVTNIGDDSAVGHGEVLNEGASHVTERGICWGLKHNPDLDDNHETNGSGLGVFSATMTNLLPNKTYYVRAYAINAKGIIFGNEESFIIEKVIEKPTVTLDSICNVTTARATVYGTLISDGGDEVIEMGVCWGTNANPNIGGEHIIIDVVMGVFSTPINGLSSGTTYHVRSYAKNAAGIAYSDDYTFTTTASLINEPTVTTHAEVTDITQTSAVCGGTIINNGGAAILERGLCWSTHPNPSVNDFTTQIGGGHEDFTGMINGLTMGTTYYLKAYAKNIAGTGYGEERVFTTLSRPEGTLDHLFSVGENKQVWFSSGNLQYLATTNTWRLAESQVDCAGDDNSGMQSTWGKWIDLFGWGTSNYPHRTDFYQPWSTNSTNSNYYAYNQPSYHLYDQTGQADWGYNPISNGGNIEHVGWRTLNYSEWNYLLTQRQTSSGARFAKATVMGVCGLIVFPDDWNTNVYTFNYVNSSVTSFAANTLTDDVWNTVESAGVVFLPAAGSRYGRQITNLNSVGYYWSSSNKGGGTTAYYLLFNGSEINTMQDSGRCYGRIVRLVFDKP